MPPPQSSSAGAATAHPDPPRRLTVFLPCHTLDDFPTWLDDREADDLLAAWTAAWHPALVAHAAAPPRWASVDLPPPADGPLLGIVPASCDDRFAAQFDAACCSDSRWVRALHDAEAIAEAALRGCGLASSAGVPLPGGGWHADFQALGLTVLLSELLARRMRSTLDLAATGFAEAVVAAAVAAIAGREAEVREPLQRAFDCLRACRDRYYPVDVWLVDLVLVSAPGGAALAAELEEPAPLGVVAGPRPLASLAAADPDLAGRLRDAVAAGTVAVCGGPLDGRPLDACTPEELLDSLAGGRDACRDALGAVPTTFARRGGGGSAMLPQLLGDLGYTTAIWDTFDGNPLPDPGSGLVRWEGSGDGAVDALGRPPLDARAAATILALPERIGDAMDHDHVAVVTFARPAGTASAWHALLRRGAGWGTALGTFVTPGELATRAAGGGTPVAFAPDAFPPTLPADDPAAGDEIGVAVAAAASAARRLRCEAEAVRGLLPAEEPRPDAAARAEPTPARRTSRWWRRAGRDDELVLENESIRVQVHPRTGGILSLRRPADRGNRLSQRLALRQADGHGPMDADAIDRGTTASGVAGLVSRGRLLDASGREAGRFTQGVSLVAGLPLVRIDVEVQLARPCGGGLLDRHAACRFAWHENEEVEVRRSLHTQAIVTERTRFTAPHFVEIRASDHRGAVAGPVTILSGGMPWHVRSSPHVLDTILAGGGTTHAVRRLAVGVGLERPWDLAIDWLAEAPPAAGRPAAPAHVRLTGHGTEAGSDRPLRARVGLLESTGRAGNVRVAWGREVVSATACGPAGRPRAGVAVAIEGRETVVWLRPYEWLLLDLEFRA